MRLRRDLPALLLAIPLLIYGVCPLGSMLLESASLPVVEYRARRMGWDAQQQPAGAGLRVIFSEQKTRDAAAGTLLLSAASVVLAGAWGLGLALLWARREFPGRAWFYALGFSPVLMPPIVGTLAFQSLAGESGWLWRHVPAIKFFATPFARVLLVHVYSFGCYTYAYVAAALESGAPEREEAARSLGGNAWRSFAAATWPQIRAPLLAAALLTFMASAASFSAPYMLDNSGRYLSVEIFNESGDPGLQRALGVLLALISLAALPPFLMLMKRGGATQGIIARVAGLDDGAKGNARGGLPGASKRESRWRLGLSIIAALPLLAPPAMAIAGVWSAPGNANSSGENSGVFSAFQALDADDWNALLRSLEYGAATALIAVALAALIALALRRASAGPALAVETAVMLALALPGSSVAVALLSQFNAPSWAAFGRALGGTSAILILAYLIRTLPLAVRPARAAVEALGGDLEDAARSLGARSARVFFKVLLPCIAAPLMAGGLLCFVTAAGEFVASMLLFAPETQTASVRIDQLSRTDPRGASALALCLMLACALPILASRLPGVLRNWRVKSRGSN